MDYLATLNTTFKQWWKHKYLWIVGILGSILAGSGTGSNFNFSNFSSKDTNSLSQMDFLNDPATMSIVIVVVVIVLLLSLVFFALALYLQARADSGLFQATQKLHLNDNKIGFWNTWALGKFRLKTLVGQQLLIGAPIYLLGLIFILAIIAVLVVNKNNPSGMSSGLLIILGCATIFICIVAIYSILASLASLFGRRISVLENIGALEGLKRGFNFFGANFADIFVFWLVSWLVGLVAMVVTLPVTLVCFGFAIAIIIPMLIINPVLAIVAGVAFLAIFTVFIVLLEGPVYAFTQMYWTNVYLEIKKAKS
jgi:hypothetical protein